MEQQKRLTIAVELVELVSELEAGSAAVVMKTVRNTVDDGRTVVCTIYEIYQPSIDILEKFEEGIGVRKMKDGYNPATWILEVASSTQEMIFGVDFAEMHTTVI
ncbi:ABC transporter G family member 40 [Forsythia ovata]|uniref:ABC transporter G family member 40 n=1 Tax=Forsythia ovata TaxID=205694 RepID=A0ABD1P5V8_9LAMI